MQHHANSDESVSHQVAKNATKGDPATIAPSLPGRPGGKRLSDFLPADLSAFLAEAPPAEIAAEPAPPAARRMPLDAWIKCGKDLSPEAQRRPRAGVWIQTAAGERPPGPRDPPAAHGGEGAAHDRQGRRAEVAQLRQAHHRAGRHGDLRAGPHRASEAHVQALPDHPA